MDNPEVTNKNMLPAERRVVATIATIGMLRMFGLFSLLPVLALHAARMEEATPFLVGLAVGGYGLTQALLQIPFGALSDRIGRVPVVLAGLALFTAGSLIAAFSESIYGIIVGRFLQGGGAISATLGAFIADSTRDSVRTRSMAIFGAGVGLAFIVAMIAGPIIAAKFGVRYLFFISALVAVAAAALLLSIPKEATGQVHATRWSFKATLKPALLRIDLYIFLLHGVLTASFVALPFLLSSRLQMPETEHWTIYVTAMVLSLVITVPLIFRDERQGKRQTVIVAVLLMLAAQLLLAFGAVAIWTVFLAMTLFFAGFNFLEAALPARVTTIADQESRGASLGVFSSSQFLGAFVGGVLGGWFIGTGSPSNVFFMCVLMLAIWLGVQSRSR